LKIATSNDAKIKEFNRFGLNVVAEKGLDLKEVQSSSSLTVAAYKAIEAGEGVMVEDTVLEINGTEIVDIRYQMQHLKDCINNTARWIVTLAVVDGNAVKLSKGIINGTIRESDDHGKPDVFGFDAVFHPDGGEGLSLHQLEQANRKDDFSARKLAVIDFLQEPVELDLELFPKWEGEYQK
jgi:inosine/xanthosine triphosphate pyrophosphatase family protein